MMEDLDSALAGVALLPADPRLDALDAAVWHDLAQQRRDSRLPAMALIAAAFLAFGSGLAGTALFTPPRQPALFPLGAPPALSPSVLLGDAE
ncbi:MAG: hypothetical protein RIS94_1403 [Pseudomonadota bacterium]